MQVAVPYKEKLSNFMLSMLIFSILSSTKFNNSFEEDSTVRSGGGDVDCNTLLNSKKIKNGARLKNPSNNIKKFEKENIVVISYTAELCT